MGGGEGLRLEGGPRDHRGGRSDEGRPTRARSAPRPSSGASPRSAPWARATTSWRWTWWTRCSMTKRPRRSACGRDRSPSPSIAARGAAGTRSPPTTCRSWRGPSRQSGIVLPDRQLACAPVHSKEGEDYFKAMACGANYAWANRQMILHWVTPIVRGALQAEGRGHGHAPGIRRGAQHRQGGGARGRRQQAEGLRAPQGSHQGVPPGPPGGARPSTVRSDSRSSSPATWATAATCWWARRTS